YRDRLGTKISVAEVYRIATAITARYRNDGYILSRTIVPPQTIQGGIVHLRVIEGYIDGFRIEGNPGDARGRIEQYGTAITGTRPVTASVLERYLLLINDLPGISAQAVLVPSADAVGASTVNLI